MTPTDEPTRLQATPAAALRPGLDPVALGRAIERIHRESPGPWLHAEVARRMAERLPVVRLQPDHVVDWWPGAGGSAAPLTAAYPRAQRVAVAPVAANAAPPAWWSPRRWRVGTKWSSAAELPAGGAQLVWANMMLHACQDPQAIMREWHRELAVNGFLMFSTLGPGTLPQLRRIYADAGWGPPMVPLVDMHDLGDMLIEAGFSDPVTDQETLTLAWSDADAVLEELRTLGANVAQARYAGLRTPAWQTRLHAELLRTARNAQTGRIELHFEVIYGHAFKPLPRARVSAESTVSLDDMRTMVRQGSAKRAA